MSPPTDSTAWAMSRALRASVPLNSRCSRKWLVPACSLGSSREPVPTQNPIAAERKAGSSSVTTRTPAPGRVRLIVICGSIGRSRSRVYRRSAVPTPTPAASASPPAAAAAPASAGPAASAAAAATPTAPDLRRAEVAELGLRLLLEEGLERGRPIGRPRGPVIALPGRRALVVVAAGTRLTPRRALVALTPAVAALGVGRLVA